MAGPLGGFLSGQKAGEAENVKRETRLLDQYYGALDRIFRAGSEARGERAEARQGTADRNKMIADLFAAAASVTPDTYDDFRYRVKLANDADPDLGLPPEYFDNRFNMQAQAPAAPPRILRSPTGNAEPEPGTIGPPAPEPDLPRPTGTPEAAGAAPPPESAFRFQSPEAEATYLRQQVDLKSARAEAQYGNEFNTLANNYLLDKLTDPVAFGRASAEFRAWSREHGFSDKFVDDQLQEITASAVKAQDWAAEQVGKTKERDDQKRMAVKDLEGFLGRALAKSDGFGNFSLDASTRGLYLFLLEKGTSAVESGQTAAEAFRYLSMAYGDQPGFKVAELNPYAQGILGAPEWFVEKLRQMPPGAEPYWSPQLGRGGVKLPDGRKYELDPPNRTAGGR